MRLYVLFLGEACVDKGAVLSPGVDDGKRVHIPIPAYLLQTDDGRNVLIDTGMHANHVEDPEYTFRGQEIGKVLLPAMREEDRIENRLAALGLQPSDVDTVINTHLHFDHCGQNGMFPHARFIVQRRHYEAAKELPAFPNEYFDIPGLEYELIDGEPEILPGIRAILTPGHAPWHQSLLISLGADGNVLLCSDAIYCQDNLDHDAWGGQMEPDVARESAHKLLGIAKETNATMVYGHDTAQWKTLRKVPAYYS
jgi:N-acyl homoserine lactone hydrolase